MKTMLKTSGECKCGLIRDIECDDPDTIQKLKEMPCHNCGSRLKYKTDDER